MNVRCQFKDLPTGVRFILTADTLQVDHVKLDRNHARKVDAIGRACGPVERVSRSVEVIGRAEPVSSPTAVSRASLAYLHGRGAR